VSRFQRLSALLQDRDLTFDGVIVNGVEPTVFWEPKVADVARRVVAGDRSPVAKKWTELLAPGADYVRERCDVAAAQRAVLESFDADTVTTVPRLIHSPTNLDELRSIGELLWSESAQQR